MTNDELSRVMDLERELQSAEVRRDAARLRELLAPSFVEFGASGRRWDRDGILALLADEAARGEVAPIGIAGLEGRLLCDDVIQVFWESEREGHRARRTSLWRREEAGWRQVYHQGTACTE